MLEKRWSPPALSCCTVRFPEKTNGDEAIVDDKSVNTGFNGCPLTAYISNGTGQSGRLRTTLGLMRTNDMQEDVLTANSDPNPSIVESIPTLPLPDQKIPEASPIDTPGTAFLLVYLLAMVMTIVICTIWHCITVTCQQRRLVITMRRTCVLRESHARNGCVA